MSFVRHRILVVVLLVMAWCDLSTPAGRCQEGNFAPDLPPPPQAAVKRLLAQPILFNGFDADPKLTLQEGLEHLSDRFGVVFDVDEKAFEKAHPRTDPVLQSKIAQQPIPRMKNVALTIVLNRILSRVDPPATYRVRSGVVQIIPLKHARLDDLFTGKREFVPCVSIQFYKTSVKEGLEELAEQSGISVVVDGRIIDRVEKASVTATLNQVPVDTAVRMLADMAEAKPVILEGAIYVTSKPNAEALQQDQDRSKHQRQVRPKPESPSPSPNSTEPDRKTPD